MQSRLRLVLMVFATSVAMPGSEHREERPKRKSVNTMKLVFVLFLIVLSGCSTSSTPAPIELGREDWISFELTASEHILVTGAVNGKTTRLIVDTGAEASLLDLTFAKRMGVPMEKGARIIGVTGAAKGFVAKNIEISVGNMALQLPRVIVVDLSQFGRISGRAPTVVLGAEVFMRSVVDIDYPHRRLAFRQADSHSFPAAGKKFDLKLLKSGRHAVSAAIEGRAPAWYLIDTGSAGTSIYPTLIERQAILVGRAPISKWISLGIGGMIFETTASISRFSIGNYQVNDLPVSAPTDDGGFLAKSPFEGTIGNEVLGRFRVILDFSHDQMYLESTPQRLSAPFARNIIGLAALPEAKTLKVLFVAPGSPAFHAGWRKDMHITAVNGVKGTGVELNAIFRKLSRTGLGSSVSLLDGNGHERLVERARFY